MVNVWPYYISTSRLYNLRQIYAYGIPCSMFCFHSTPYLGEQFITSIARITIRISWFSQENHATSTLAKQAMENPLRRAWVFRNCAFGLWIRNEHHFYCILQWIAYPGHEFLISARTGQHLELRLSKLTCFLICNRLKVGRGVVKTQPAPTACWSHAQLRALTKTTNPIFLHKNLW